MLDLNEQSILITGGTGTLGKALVKTIYEKWPNVKRLVIFSRDEQKQFEMEQEYPKKQYDSVRFFIGDVRDKERLLSAFQGIDIIIHAAAMKHVPIAEYNPMEAIKTNINGAENVIKAALDTQVKNVVALSTDKAAAPINLYGATKLASDKLFIAANNIKGTRDIKFSVVRYGNVLGSKGSVIPFFKKRSKNGCLPITHPDMTRFNISLQDGVEMVLFTLEHAFGGEIYVPKLPSYRITDLAAAVCPDCKQEVVGIRPGEKLHEEMITSSDSFYTYDIGKYYAILPAKPVWKEADFVKKFKARKVEQGFSYTSTNNEHWETPETLSALIDEHLSDED